MSAFFKKNRVKSSSTEEGIIKEGVLDTDVPETSVQENSAVEGEINVSAVEDVVSESEGDKDDALVNEEKSSISKEQPKRQIIHVCKMGSDHIFANKNNQDYAFNLLNMKIVLDGCGSGKHSEIGTGLFAQLFAREVKNYNDQNIIVGEDNYIYIVNCVFRKMLEMCSDTTFIFQNYCFTILICFELEDRFVVCSCGDGYIIKENSEGITFEELDDGEYPRYYIYNYIEDKSKLAEYKDGVSFNVTQYLKKDYFNVGVASDGLRFFENLLDVEKNKFIGFLHDGKGPQIEMLINRNNRKNEMFHDDISICF